MERKITWNDINEATQHEIRKTYKYGHGREGDRKLETDLRRHLDGANAQERREVYQKFYGKR